MDARADIKPLIAELPRNKKRIGVSAKRGIKSSRLLELDYYSKLAQIVNTIVERFENTVLAKVDRPKTLEVIHDASWSADIEKALAEWKASLKRQFHSDRIKNLTSTYVNKTDRYQKTKFKTLVEYGFGIDVGNLPEFKAYKPFINSAIKRNMGLIKSLNENTIHRLEMALRTAIEQGTSVAQLKTEIMKTKSVSKGKAVVIARNEIKNVTNMLTQKRLQNVGFNEYEWQTAEDERVRGNPSGAYPPNKWINKHNNHYIMNGLLCKFDDPTVYSNDKGKTWKARTSKMPTVHAGQAILCRCDTIPYVRLD